MNGRLVIEPLDSTHERQFFNSGSEELDRFIRIQAGQENRRHVASVYVARDVDSKLVAGYHTVSSTAINLLHLPVSEAKKLPKYPFLPATLIGRLAVDQTWKGKGLGKVLLYHALTVSLKASELVASIAVVVDAKDDGARKFYEHHHFTSFPDQPHRLYLKMDTIARLIA